VSSQAAAVTDVTRARTSQLRGFTGPGCSRRDGGVGGAHYAFFVLAARTLGPEATDRSEFSGRMFIGVIVLFRPLEQTLTRAIAERIARGRESGPSSAPSPRSTVR